MFSFLRKRRTETYHGDIAQTALPDMFYVLYRHGAAGLIECTQGEIAKKIYVKNGACIQASSNDPQDRLLPFLKREQRITPEQYQAVIKSPAESDLDREVMLMDRGMLSPLELYQAQRARLESIVWSLFWWKEGELVFNVVPEEAELIHIHIPIRHVIVHGVRRAPSAKALTARLGKRTTVYEPTYELADLVDVALDKDEYKLLTLVNGSRNLYEICAQGPFSPGENAKLLYAYHVLRLITKSSAQPAEHSVTDLSDLPSTRALPDSGDDD